jgi:hypothetical protein
VPLIDRNPNMEESFGPLTTSIYSTMMPHRKSKKRFPSISLLRKKAIEEPEETNSQLIINKNDSDIFTTFNNFGDKSFACDQIERKNKNNQHQESVIKGSTILTKYR